jgi:hypothetical protein
MGVKTFHLAGETAEHGSDLDIGQVTDFSALQEAIATNFSITLPREVGFQDKTRTLESLEDIKSTNEPISVTISGRSVRETPGPEGLPYVGSYLQSQSSAVASFVCACAKTESVFPDHLGNNQRLFERYGPVFKSTSMGVTTYQTNDPQIAQIVLTESEYFSKEINKSHPLYPIKNDMAGVFLGDSTSPSWKVVHKFMPPALGPKAVRHYSKVNLDASKKMTADQSLNFGMSDHERRAARIFTSLRRAGVSRLGLERLPIHAQAQFRYCRQNRSRN